MTETKKTFYIVMVASKQFHQTSTEKGANYEHTVRAKKLV